MGIELGSSSKNGGGLLLGGQSPAIPQQAPQQTFQQVPQQAPQQVFQQTPQQGVNSQAPQQPFQQSFQQPPQFSQQPQQTFTPQPQGNGFNVNQSIPAQNNSMPTGGLNLTKGAKLDLTKGNPSLDQLVIGLGWDVNGMGHNVYDLDVEVFLLNAQRRAPSQSHIVFYNNLRSVDGAVVHNGDNRTGDGVGDDETVSIKLSQVSPDIERIVFTVTIDEAAMKGQNFGQISNAYIRTVDQATGQEICRFDLTEDYSTAISLVAGELYRHNGEWRFGALGQGTTLDLAGLCQQYGAM